jgi:hypothetical protein
LGYDVRGGLFAEALEKYSTVVVGCMGCACMGCACTGSWFDDNVCCGLFAFGVAVQVHCAVPQIAQQVPHRHSRVGPHARRLFE